MSFIVFSFNLLCIYPCSYTGDALIHCMLRHDQDWVQKYIKSLEDRLRTRHEPLKIVTTSLSIG